MSPVRKFITNLMLFNSHRFQGQQGSLFYNTATAQYAAVYLLQASPTQLCPFYNNARYTDPAGNVWQVFCGYSALDAVLPASTTAAAGEDAPTYHP